ncbi:MAG: penicillin acylase family protein [Xanthomonadales bacterium]|nr:penicillin acylase family protein [Xanthomonadales bacterium]ODU92779.1 MAG: peptidase S45 [Rhodanobacter sp. SCN 66-43]OJY83855.1 MAG: penicillin acylase family protein [Xanthomonadales bacterium 66-474]
MRWIRRVVVALIVIIVIAFALGWRLLAGSRPQADGNVAVQGLSAAVTIARDADGIPVITAGNRGDLAWALGFVHGQERFFQMDLQRRVAAGELAALVGAKALPVDESHRKHRFRVLAERELALMSPRQRALMDAYTAGVNAGLAHLSVRPWEYLLLGVKPQPWTDADSILTIDAMFLDLNQDGDNARELNIARLRAVLPRSLADFLLAPSPRWEAPMQGGPMQPVPMPDAGVFDLRHAATGKVALAPGARAIAMADAANTGIGSNSSAVGGALAGGAAIIANDPHLHLRVPNIWYRAQLRYPDPSEPGKTITLNGVTLPGAPALVIGSNGHIAWGFTNSGGDWMDWVRVVRDPHDPSHYKTANGWATLARHDEVIHVKGAPDAHVTVEDTIWGPIMGEDTDGTPLALAWTAQDPRAVNLDLLKLETATTVDQALALAPTIGIPPQNLVVADAQGNIGWSIAGSLIPIRAGIDPSVPSDWSQPGSGWIGYATPAQYPRIENPAESRIWTANQRIVSGDALTLVGDGGYDQGARAQQVRDDLAARDRFVPRDMLDIQLDDRALFLERWQKLLTEVLAQSHCDQLNPGSAHVHVPAGTSASCTRLAALAPFVKDWQARAATGSVGYRIVRLFHDKVRENALAPFAALASARWKDFEWPTVEVGEYATWTMLTQRPAWLLDPKYRDWNALLEASARDVADELAALPGPLADKTWGQHNTARIDNPLSVALPGWLARFVDMPHDELAGDNNMPRVMHRAFGASMRMDVQPGNEAHGILEMPAGQSDNPLSPWFGKGHEAWVHGKPTPLLPGPAKYRLTLEPAR